MPKHKNNKTKSSSKSVLGQAISSKLKLILDILALALITVAVIAQIAYNKIVWDRLEETSNLKVAMMIQNAMDGLENLKSSPTKLADGSLLIEEGRLKLPPANENIRNLIYFYNWPTSGTDENGYTWDDPEFIEVTTKQIAGISKYKVLNGTTVEDTFDAVPEAQACNRGFKIQFEEGEGFDKSVRLEDGRTMFLFRDAGCKMFAMDALEDYLLQAKSY